MFEEYLEDAYFFATRAQDRLDTREGQRYYRAAVFYVLSALEAFVNFIAETFEAGEALEDYERAFLLDRGFGLRAGRFEVLDAPEYHRLDQKLRLLLSKFCGSYKLAREGSWSNFLELKKLRDAIVHPREGQELSSIEHRQQLARGLDAVVEIMNLLCEGIFQKPLRRRLRDLTLATKS